MSRGDSHDDEAPSVAGAVISQDALTPRGGFMARPGLKAPPKHAVVVRLGDAPESTQIPEARSSMLPPAPPSEPPPLSSSEQITLRAIPLAGPTARPADTTAQPTPPVVVESVPPASDAPVVTQLPEPPASAPPSRRAISLRWTTVAAAAAGLILGLVSVATTAGPPRGASRAPATTATIEARPAHLASAGVPQPSAFAQASPPPASAEPPPAPVPAVPAVRSPAAPSRPPSSVPKRTIF